MPTNKDEKKVKTGSTKNKNLVSKAVSVNKHDTTGLPIELLTKLADFGIVPRVDFDHVKMQDTGSPRLNWICGGGFPIGRVTTLSGKKKTGKTTIAVLACAQTLVEYPQDFVFYFDTENKFDIAWAESLGMDMTRFIFCPIETGEQLINALPSILALPNCRGVVIDSIRGTKWDAEANADAEAQQMGIGGKMWNKAARKLSSPVKKSNAWVLFLNGVYKTFDANSHEMIEPGGEGIPFMAGLRLRTRPAVVINEQGVNITLACLESQTGRNSGREGTISVRFVGSQAVADIIPELSALAKDLAAIDMSGSWFKVGEEKWNGAPAFETAMREDQELQDYVYDAVMSKLSADYVPPQRTYEELLNEPEEEVDEGVDLERLKLTEDLFGGDMGQDIETLREMKANGEI